MVPSDPSRQPCNHGTAKFKSWASPAPRLTRASPTPGRQNCAIATRTHDQPGPRPPLGVSSTSCDRTQHLYHYLPAPAAAHITHIQLGLRHNCHVPRAIRPRVARALPSITIRLVAMHHGPQLLHGIRQQPKGQGLWKEGRIVDRSLPSMNVVTNLICIPREDGESECATLFFIDGMILMKHRSIRVGFDSLRQVVPSASDTDSKASILNKAVGHIVHLESLLQEIRRSQGITLDPNPVNNFISIKNEDQG